ncbi:hypothetical protein BWI96_15935 [Siphonobacter sp. SORGH_AS_0500]|uniref:winged helix DNA-binding domain-containing protein n=1 Tax=Siphonobacter sp. SORGH_AS_0500 TaxID=1864824 RepID=UPI000CC8087C|nr:winged helix DNA-binding domain-containing protein [Siphonobacter sp. SORGH_AS_0500]PKK35596.1 hypothetical protein BWI96_15935 [Siphonobacter sp. SORGH_AS_0500]
MKTQLEQSGFSCEGLRFNHLLVRAAIEGLICLGPREGKEFTYVLRDEWISGKHIKTREEALAEWAFRYFTSHGPATIADFAWWSGLTMNEAKMGLASVEPELARIIFNHETYWMSPKMEPAPAHTVHLLPSFDEFLLGYRDRSLALAKEHLFSVVGSNNGLFKPIIVKNGQVIGIWKRVMIKKEYQIETRFFDGKEVNIKDAIQAVLTYAN